jgi:uroporphyrinogen decarboxylase
MNGFERINKALRGESPDQTPVMLHNFQMAAHEAGFSMAEFRSDPKNICATFVQAIETYGYDGILVDVDTATMAGAVGVPVDFPQNDPARVHDPLLKELDHFQFLEEINIENYPPVQIWCEAVALLKAYFKDEIYIRGNCDQAPFSLASMLRTPQEWMMDLVMEEEKSLQLLEICTGLTIQFVEAMARTGCDMVSNGDSSAGPEMISPEMYQKFALPFEQRLIQAAHQAGVAYTLHICGDTTKILDLMVESGADAIELDYKTNTQAACKSFAEKVTFIGNIDPSGILAMGSVADVERETRKLLEIFSNNPRLIVNAGCSIPPRTPKENLEALIKTARET